MLYLVLYEQVHLFDGHVFVHHAYSSNCCLQQCEQLLSTAVCRENMTNECLAQTRTLTIATIGVRCKAQHALLLYRKKLVPGTRTTYQVYRKSLISALLRYNRVLLYLKPGT